MTVLTADSFNRANSTTSLGTTDGSGTADPLTWVQHQGINGISSNRAYTSAGVGLCTVDTGQANIDASLTLVNTVGAGLMFRYTNTTNHWLAVGRGTETILYRVVAGSYNVDYQTATGGAAGDVLRIVANGSAIQLFRNGVSLTTVTSSHNSTATRHGFYTESTTSYVDNFSVSDLVVAPTSVPYVGAVPILS